MPTNNSICNVCGKKYYSCHSCNNVFRWKSVVCSIKCFQTWNNKQNNKTAKDGDSMSKAKKLNIVHPLRGMAYENNQMHDFKDYHILSEKENWLKSTYKDREYEVNDIQYFYIPRITFLDIIDDIRKDAYDEGFKDGRKKLRIKE